jgi:hypothetical protein
VWQVKHDGWRAQAHVGTGALYSGHGRAITPSFPDVVESLTQLLGDRDVLVDGELVVLGAGGRQDFTALGARGACGARTAARAAAATPARLSSSLMTCTPTARRSSGRRMSSAWRAWPPSEPTAGTRAVGAVRPG